jgi:hypothetical protein
VGRGQARWVGHKGSGDIQAAAVGLASLTSLLSPVLPTICDISWVFLTLVNLPPILSPESAIAIFPCIHGAFLICWLGVPLSPPDFHPGSSNEVQNRPKTDVLVGFMIWCPGSVLAFDSGEKICGHRGNSSTREASSLASVVAPLL